MGSSRAAPQLLFAAMGALSWLGPLLRKSTESVMPILLAGIRKGHHSCLMTLRIEEMKAYMASFIVEGQGRSFSIKQRQLETMLAQGTEKLQQLRTTVDLSVFPVLSHR